MKAGLAILNNHATNLAHHMACLFNGLYVNRSTVLSFYCIVACMNYLLCHQKMCALSCIPIYILDINYASESLQAIPQCTQLEIGTFLLHL